MAVTELVPAYYHVFKPPVCSLGYVDFWRQERLKRRCLSVSVGVGVGVGVRCRCVP